MILKNSVFLGLNDICHSWAHFITVFKLYCKAVTSVSSWTGLYTSVSSAYWHTDDMLCAMSFSGRFLLFRVNQKLIPPEIIF